MSITKNRNIQVFWKRSWQSIDSSGFSPASRVWESAGSRCSWQFTKILYYISSWAEVFCARGRAWWTSVQLRLTLSTDALSFWIHLLYSKWRALITQKAPLILLRVLSKPPCRRASGYSRCRGNMINKDLCSSRLTRHVGPFSFSTFPCICVY